MVTHCEIGLSECGVFSLVLLFAEGFVAKPNALMGPESSVLGLSSLDCGDNPFSLIGGTGEIWIRAKEQAGKVRITATHPWLGKQELEIAIVDGPAEAI
jgi:hypothetical protein